MKIGPRATEGTWTSKDLTMLATRYSDSQQVFEKKISIFCYYLAKK
jgi:hypothetical protein